MHVIEKPPSCDRAENIDIVITSKIGLTLNIFNGLSVRSDWNEQKCTFVHY